MPSASEIGNPPRRLLFVLTALLALTLVASACGDDDNETASTDATEKPVDASTDNGADGTETATGETALSDAADELAVACGGQDRDRLRDLSGAGIRDRIRDRDSLFSAVDDLTVADRQIDIDGDSATVTVTLDVTIDGETSQVDRVWTYERVDGEWFLSDVPDCLFQ